MRGWAGLVLLAACGTKADVGGADEADTDVTGDADTDADTDTDTESPATGCYDVPMGITGGFAEAGQPFVAAPDSGSVAQMVHGPQGGWHVDTAIRVESTHDIVSATPSITVVSTGEVISGLTGAADFNHVPQEYLVLDGACSGTITGLRAFIDDVDPDPAVLETLSAHICALDGAEVEFAWTVGDVVDGREGTDTARATFALDPIDVAECSGN